MSKRLFPLALDLTGRRCLVVGDGDEARARAQTLLTHGARVAIVTRDASRFRSQATPRELTIIEATFSPELLDGVWLVVLTDRDPRLARVIADACEEHRIFHCAVDQPDHSSFAHVATTRVGPLSVAVSTDGQAPGLAKRLKQEFSRVLEGSEIEEFLRACVELRNAAPPGQRGADLEAVLDQVRLEGRLSVPKPPLK